MDCVATLSCVDAHQLLACSAAAHRTVRAWPTKDEGQPAAGDALVTPELTRSLEAASVVTRLVAGGARRQPHHRKAGLTTPRLPDSAVPNRRWHTTTYSCTIYKPARQRSRGCCALPLASPVQASDRTASHSWACDNSAVVEKVGGSGGCFGCLSIGLSVCLLFVVCCSICRPFCAGSGGLFEN